MKKMPKSCGLDGVMMLQMSQIFEKNIHFAHVFIRVFQILYIKDRRIGIVFFSKHGFDKLCMGFTWEFLTAHGVAWDFSTAHGFFRKKCCLRLAGYLNSFPQYIQVRSSSFFFMGSDS